MGIKKRFAVATVFAASALLLSPGFASAGNPALCAANRACIYLDDDWSGLIDIPRAPGGGIRNVNAGDNDEMDSWENRTSTRAAWYHNANGGGDCVNMNANSEDDDINVFDSDELSSWRTNRGC
jgi:hypothetical protein